MGRNKIYLLLIESSTEACSVALSEGQEIVSLFEERSTRDHASIITIMVEKVLQEGGIKSAELSAVVLSEGPGSYTSLRVGMSTAKGICFAHDIPLIAVNTLETLAVATRDVYSEGFICSMIDARRMEVYASLYDENMKMTFDNKALILEEDTFNYTKEDNTQIVLCGNGAEKCFAFYKGKNMLNSGIKCSAKNLLKPGYSRFRKGNFSDLAYFSPNYIKSPNITVSKKKLL